MKHLIHFTAKLKTEFFSVLPDAAISLFLIAGSLCGFLSAFDISCDFIVVIFCFFLAAVFLHINMLRSSFRRFLGYVCYFIIYFLGVSSLGNYINTGFYYILNETITALSAYVGATDGQEYRLLVSDTMNAVTVFTIFIGMFLLIPIASAVSRKKSVISSVVYTFPAFAIPVYVHQEPGFFWSVLLICGYLLLLAFRWMHRGRENLENKITPRTKLVFIGGLWGMISIFVLIFSLIFPDSLYQKNYTEPDFKTAGYEKTATLLQFGLSGFFNNYTGAGGMAGGVLGGIYAIQPDYETDLIAEFSPFNADTLYLRGYVGITYDHNRWLSTDDFKDSKTFVPYDDLISEVFSLKKDFENNLPFSEKELIRIRNVGASPLYSYVPYYSDEENTTAEDSYANYVVYPYHQTVSHRILQQSEHEFYLSVPEDNAEVIQNLCKDKKISGTTDEIIAKIQNLFSEEYTYTMMPGKTPSKEDFVTYFLTKSKKGYCAHFASSAVLMLRSLGIPARYVEGYALGASEMQDGTVLRNKDVNDYHKGYRELEESGVLRCEINDSQAHAWVEYYDENFGWRIAEFTPAGSEETSSASLLSSLAGLFGQQTPSFLTISRNTKTDSRQTDGNISSVETTFPGLLLCIDSALIFSLVLWYLRYFYCTTPGKLIRIYSLTCDKIRKKQPAFSSCHSHREQLGFLKEHYLRKSNTADLEELGAFLQKISYATFEEHKFTKEEKRLVKNLCKILWAARLRT